MKKYFSQFPQNRNQKSLLNTLVGATVALGVAGIPAQAITISLNADPGLSSNTDALNAFQRAAAQWENYLLDPITVNINANFQDLNSPNTIGQASSVVLESGYSTLRDAVVADAALESDDTIATFLPTADQASFILPNGFGLNGNLSANKANLKALGFTNLDASFGNTDATITFNSQFNFDFDNRDGVGSGLTDFETVAAHEIGHALGFTSIVDVIDSFMSNGQTTNVAPTILDLYRFGEEDPSTTTEFTTFSRDLRPNTTAFFDDVLNEWAFSEGTFTGDGRQASHWKADELIGTFIGIMDPTLASGQVYPITQADLRAMDLIGYNVNVTVVPFEFSPGLGLVTLGGLLSLQKVLQALYRSRQN